MLLVCGGNGGRREESVTNRTRWERTGTIATLSGFWSGFALFLIDMSSCAPIVVVYTQTGIIRAAVVESCSVIAISDSSSLVSFIR